MLLRDPHTHTDCTLHIQRNGRCWDLLFAPAVVVSLLLVKSAIWNKFSYMFVHVPWVDASLLRYSNLPPEQEGFRPTGSSFDASTSTGPKKSMAPLQLRKQRDIMQHASRSGQPQNPTKMRPPRLEASGTTFAIISA